MVFFSISYSGFFLRVRIYNGRGNAIRKNAKIYVSIKEFYYKIAYNSLVPIYAKMDNIFYSGDIFLTELTRCIIPENTLFYHVLQKFF